MHFERRPLQTSGLPQTVGSQDSLRATAGRTLSSTQVGRRKVIIVYYAGPRKVLELKAIRLRMRGSRDTPITPPFRHARPAPFTQPLTCAPATVGPAAPGTELISTPLPPLPPAPLPSSIRASAAVPFVACLPFFPPHQLLGSLSICSPGAAPAPGFTTP